MAFRAWKQNCWRKDFQETSNAGIEDNFRTNGFLIACWNIVI